MSAQAWRRRRFEASADSAKFVYDVLSAVHDGKKDTVAVVRATREGASCRPRAPWR